MIKQSAWIKANFPKLKEACADAGIEIKLIDGVRAPEVQTAYYAQGRESLKSVNALRATAGLVPIDEKTNSYTITNTLHSDHIFGFAFDIVIVVEGRFDWNDMAQYKRVAEIGKGLGLKAGYFFPKVDACHFARG